jgi:hypothetical protein
MTISLDVPAELGHIGQANTNKEPPVQTIEELKNALDLAEKAHDQVKMAIADAKRAAAQAIDAEYAEIRATTHAVYYQAEQAHRAAVAAAGSHEWEGKRVYREKPLYSSKWASRPYGKVPVEGIVEIRRLDTKFAENINYGLPSLGQAFVRLLKKDGKPGIAIERLGNFEWSLAEGQ